jgi:DNA-binding LacI/PurR family transcriptional regulator
VLKVIAETGFRVNFLAKGLREKRTRTLIAFVDKHHGQYWGVYHNEILQEMLKEAGKRNYRMVISASSAESFEQEEEDGFFFLKHGFADGAIMFDTKRKDQRVQYLRDHHIPFVLIGKDVDHLDTSYVDLDNVYLGFMGAEYLHAKNRRNIVLMLGDLDFIVSQERAEGFWSYVNSHPEVKGRLLHDVGSIEEAYRRTKELLGSDSVPDAIFIAGDERAIGVYSAIYEHGLTIPRDIAVLGIDKIRMGQYFQPPITSIDQSMQEMVRIAFDFLLQKLEGDYTSTLRSRLMPTLHERSSV